MVSTIRSFSYDGDKHEAVFKAIDNLPRSYKFSEVVVNALEKYMSQYASTDESTRDLVLSSDDVEWKSILKNIPNENLKSFSTLIEKKAKLVQKEVGKRLA